MTVPTQDSLPSILRAQLASEYDIEGELGRGGMAIVFKATEIALHRPVALKVLPPQLAMTESIAERFKREARMMASLDHPHVMPVYRVGEADGICFMAMKFVEGRSLDAILGSQGALPVPAVLLVLRAATAALAAAHDRGIIHRDIKGGNILVDTDGRVLVTDFGIARAADDASLTATSTVVGTPYFMSPEQCSGKRVGPQSDQYSLGVVAFQMLAGAVPFDAESLPGIMQHHFFTPVPDLTLLREGIPEALLDIVRRALAKQPEGRFASTREMLEALERIPLSPDERRAGEETLRGLARGAELPKIRTGSISAAPTIPSGEAMQPAPRPGAGALWGSTAVRRMAGRPMRLSSRLLLGVLVAILLVGAALALRDARSGRGALRRGIELYTTGERAQARLSLERAVAADPRRALPHVYLGRIAREEGDLAEATRELRTAIELEPRSAPALREMGSLQLASDNYELARRFYSRSLEIEPDDRSAQGYLGCALVKLGRVELGTRFLRRAGEGNWSACAPARRRG